MYETAITMLKSACDAPDCSIDTKLDLEGAISVLKNPGPVKIKNAVYSNEIDPKTEYMMLDLEMEDGTHKAFHFHKNNPMPTIDTIIGMTWDELVHTATGMFYLAAGCFYMGELVDPFMKPDGIHLTLPVPIGSVVYEYRLTCEDQCTVQKKNFDRTDENLGCQDGSKCHTKILNVEPFEVTIWNLGRLLDRFGKTVFAAEAKAYAAAVAAIEENKNYWKSKN